MTVTPIAPKIAQKLAGAGTPRHVIVGETMLGVMRKTYGKDMLVTNGEVWRYQDGLWKELPDATSWLNGELEVVVQALEIGSTIKLINEAKQYLLRSPKVIKHDMAWDSHGKVPTRSGLLDIRTLTLEPARPEHFATWRIECDYHRAATCPWWDQMLNDFFSDRPEELRAATISTLQEILGTALMENKSRELTRALILEGPSEAGKTRVLDVMGGLISNRPIATQLDVLGQTHGLMEFRRRAPWVLHEAFNAGTWHLSSIVKSILTGDPVQINVKNGPITTQRIKVPVFWGTNHPPQFTEATKAIVNRLIVMKCRTVFDPQNLIGAAKEAQRCGYASPSELVLAKEMPGLLNWAIVGLRRALDRGYIATTPEMVATLGAVRQDSNMVAGFIDECTDHSTDTMVSVSDFCAAFAVWWGEHKGEGSRVPSNDSIGKAMTALGDNRIAADSKDLRDNSRRYYAGLQINSIGLDFWTAAATSILAQGKTARVSATRNHVNRVIPKSWDARPTVMRLRKLARDTSKATGGMNGGAATMESDTDPPF